MFMFAANQDDLGCYLQQRTLMQKLDAIHQTSDKVSQFSWLACIPFRTPN